MSLVEVTSKLLNNPELSDVGFEFNDDVKYCSHKFILSVRSSVFNTMFYGSIPEAANNGLVQIVDISSAGFFELLRFLYTDQVNLTIENIKEVIYAAHKYDVKRLGSVCARFLAEHLCHENVIDYLANIHIYNNESSDECLKYIDLNIRELISHNYRTIYALDEEPLKLLLIRDSLNIKEINLFAFLLTWAKKRLSNDNLIVQTVVQNTKEKFMDLFKLIRFPSMSILDFSSTFKFAPNFFTNEEILAVFKYISTMQKCHLENLNYSALARASPFVMLILKTNGKFPKGHALKTVTFTVRKYLKIHHFCLSNHEGSLERFQLKLFKSGVDQPLFSANISSSTPRILCETKLVLLAPDQKYTLQTESDQNSNLEYSLYDGADYDFNFIFPNKFETHISRICYSIFVPKRKLEN